MQQGGAEMGLQLGNLLGDRRLREAKPPRRGREAARLHHRAEGPHRAQPIHLILIVHQSRTIRSRACGYPAARARPYLAPPPPTRSEEHTSELQSLMRNSSAVFCLKTKKHQ